MKLWLTQIQAISPIDGERKTYGGPYVKGISMQHAQAYCENNGMGYCKVVGELIAEIPFDGVIDFENRIDYDVENN